MPGSQFFALKTGASSGRSFILQFPAYLTAMAILRFNTCHLRSPPLSRASRLLNENLAQFQTLPKGISYGARHSMRAKAVSLTSPLPRHSKRLQALPRIRSDANYTGQPQHIANASQSV